MCELPGEWELAPQLGAIPGLTRRVCEKTAREYNPLSSLESGWLEMNNIFLQRKLPVCTVGLLCIFPND